MNKPPTSKFSRFTKLGLAVAKGAGHLAVEKIKDQIQASSDKAQKIKAARELIKSMGELKGGVMKIGQMISITEDLILPKEITEMFKTLQKDSPQIPTEELNKVFKNEFGKDLNESFKSFNPTPVAAASIGQVYQAVTFEGKEVAIKIQYPGIEGAIKNDLKNLKSIEQVLKLFIDDAPKIDGILSELKENILLECDYQKEAENQDLFSTYFKEENLNIEVPKIIPEFTSHKVLTSEFKFGDSFEDTLHYDQSSKDALGTTLYEAHLKSLFHLKKLHCDPQNGNYLFTPKKIILLDFGAVKPLSLGFISHYSALIYAVETNNLGLYKKAGENLKIFYSYDSDEIIKKHFETIKELYSPYLGEGTYAVEKVNPFQLIQNFMKTSDLVLKDRDEPDPTFIMLDRSNLGVFTKLGQWKSQVHWQKGRDEIRNPLIKPFLKDYEVRYPELFAR